MKSYKLHIQNNLLKKKKTRNLDTYFVIIMLNYFVNNI